MENSESDAGARFVTASALWLDGLHPDLALRIEGTRFRPVALADVPAGSVIAHLSGTVLPGFTDSHVHLGLTDSAAVRAGGIASVVDLGWDPALIPTWNREDDPGLLGVDFAGALLTVPGGYPANSGWAPAEAVRSIRTEADARAAVSEMVGLGASCIKIALNSDVGPVLSDELLASIVAAARAEGIATVAHTQGPGQAMRAVRAGVQRLAHTPWTERLSADDVAEMAKTCACISTLDIHGWGDYGTDFEIASDNLSRFAQAGGRVLYGTDLGNGDLPTGINPREVSAVQQVLGDLDRSVRALVPHHSYGSRISFVSSSYASVEGHNMSEWCAATEVLSVKELEMRYL